MSKNNKKDLNKTSRALVASNRALSARVTILENSVKNLGKASKVTAKYIKGDIKDSKAANIMKKTSNIVADNQEKSDKVIKRSEKFNKELAKKAAKLNDGVKKLNKIARRIEREEKDDESGGNKKKKKGRKEKKKVIKKNNGETKEISATSAEILNTLSKAKM